MSPRTCASMLVVSVLLAGCGVRLQGEPQAIERSDVPYGLLEERAVDSEDTQRASFVVYLVRDERLVAVPRVAVSPATPEVVVATLLRGPTFDEVAAGLTTAFPSSVSLQTVERSGTEVTVDLTELDLPFDALETALRQLDATLRELPGIDAVTVLVDGAHLADLPGLSGA